MSEHLGFIGVGRMGGPMAGRLLDAGHKLTIFDANQAAMAPLVGCGAVAAGSARELAAAVEAVIVSLPTPDIVRDVALGEDGIASGTRVKAVIDLSTTGPRMTQAVAAGLKAKDIALIDSPVSGGVSGAQKGTLAVMAACERRCSSGSSRFSRYSARCSTSVRGRAWDRP
jgi:3-hydroxyisobutyrate dehydrogenase-like beta-hydroxyacid dehydrogenase